MIPPLDPISGNLPPGVHEATWDEVMLRYGYTSYRRTLLSGLRRAIDVLRLFGCRRVYLNGSFVTNKEQPGDYDACWEAHDVDIIRLVRQEPLLWERTAIRSIALFWMTFSWTW